MPRAGAAMPEPPCSEYIGPPSASAAGAATSAARARRSARRVMPAIRTRVAGRSNSGAWPRCAGPGPFDSLPSDLEQEGVALAAARADRREAEAAAVPAQLVHHRAEDATAARADRVPERDGAAVHVRAFGIGA